MRKALALIVVAVVSLAAADAAGGDRSPSRVSVPGRLSLTVPPGWHVLHGWLSDVTDPAPRLAVASFPARLSGHTCECGFPNVIDFPRDGAFIFVWEYLDHFSPRALARFPGPRTRVNLARGDVSRTCDGPSDTFAFREAGRVFQVEVYVGSGADPALRTRAAALLDSLRVAASPVSSIVTSAS